MDEISQSLARFGSAFNQFYGWTTNSQFYMLAPRYLFNFYNMRVRTQDEWLSGWVPNFHNEKLNIFPTGFARQISNKVADIIFGEGLVFESGDKKNNENQALDFMSNVFDAETDLIGTIKDAIGYSVDLGNGLLKLNCDGKDLWVDALAGNRFFVSLDTRGNVVACRSYVNVFTQGMPQRTKEGIKNPDSFGLVEDRYYKMVKEKTILGQEIERKRPVVSFKIFKLNQNGTIFDPNTSDASLGYDDLPRSVQETFRKNYGNVMLKEENVLPLNSLGCYLIKFTKCIKSMPNIKLGESVLTNIINYLPKYDLIESEDTVDIKITRPKVIVPQFMAKNKKEENRIDSYMSSQIYERVPNMSDKDQIPVVFSPALRTADLINEKDEIRKSVADLIGLSVSSLFSHIADSRGTVTATEISSEESNTVLFQKNKRKLLLFELNKMVKEILLFYGYFEEVKIRFSQTGSSNITVNTDIITKKKSAGLISEYQAVKDLNPEYNENQVQEELAEINKAKPTTELGNNTL
jgi:hypothetical protein